MSPITHGSLYIYSAEVRHQRMHRSLQCDGVLAAGIGKLHRVLGIQRRARDVLKESVGTVPIKQGG